MVPIIDVSDSAASSAAGGGASQELSADESPAKLQKYGSFSSTQDLVRPTQGTMAAWFCTLGACEQQLA